MNVYIFKLLGSTNISKLPILRNKCFLVFEMYSCLLQYSFLLYLKYFFSLSQNKAVSFRKIPIYYK